MGKSQNYPKISIITAIKNSQHSIEQAIKSVISQNYPNLEYIIIDAKSTDGSIEIINKYIKFISIFISQEDSGPCSGYNKGIKLASGNLVGFLNADDYFEPNILHLIGKAYLENSNAHIFSTRYRVIENNKIIYQSNVEEMELSQKVIFNASAPNARFFQREFLVKQGQFIEKDNQNRYFLSNDLEHLIRMVICGAKNIALNYIGYNYVSHEKSLTFNNNLTTKQRLYEDKIFIAQIFLQNYQANLPINYRKTLKKWLKKYCTKIIFINLKQKQFFQAKKNFKMGIVNCGFIAFFCYFIKKLPQFFFCKEK